MHLDGQEHTVWNPWSVLLIEGCDIYRMGIEKALRAGDRLAVVASCKGPKQARDWLGDQGVECIVLGLGGSVDSFEALELVKWIRKTTPKVAIVLLADGSDHDCIRRMLRAGVRTVLMRSASPEALVTAIMKGLAGHEYIDAALSRTLLGHLFVTKERGSVDAWQLTDKEAEVLEAYASGAPTAAISAKLGLAQRTVNIHLKRMKVKLGASSSRELLVKAVRWQCGRGMRENHPRVSGLR